MYWRPVMAEERVCESRAARTRRPSSTHPSTRPKPHVSAASFCERASSSFCSDENTVPKRAGGTHRRRDASGLRRCARGPDGSARRAEARAQDKTVQLNARAAEFVNKIGPAVQPELFYAIELRFLQSGVLASYEPLSNQLHLTKRITDEGIVRLNDAINLLSATEQASGDLILVIGNFARNDLLYGARGYRRTLIEAGRVVEAMRQLAGELRVSLEFADRVVDGILECDGVEEGTVAVIEL